MRASSRLCAAALLTWAASCAPPPWVPDAGPAADAGLFINDACMGPRGASTVVTLGTGITDFRTLTDGQDLDFEAGPQGGHHVWVTLRARGVLQAETLTTYSATDITDGSAPRVLITRTVPFVLDQDEGGFCVLTGVRLQLDEDPTVAIASLVGHRIELRVSIRDANGRAAQDTRTITLRAPPDTIADGGSSPPP